MNLLQSLGFIREKSDKGLKRGMISGGSSQKVSLGTAVGILKQQISGGFHVFGDPSDE